MPPRTRALSQGPIRGWSAVEPRRYPHALRPNGRRRPNVVGLRGWPPEGAGLALLPGGCFTSPLRGPCSLSGGCSPVVSRGICLVAAQLDSDPRSRNNLQAATPSPMATQKDNSKLRPSPSRSNLDSTSKLFRRSAARPQARQGRKKRANTIQCNSNPCATGRSPRGPAMRASAVDTALRGVVSSPQVPVRQSLPSYTPRLALEETT